MASNKSEDLKTATLSRDEGCCNIFPVPPDDVHNILNLNGLVNAAKVVGSLETVAAESRIHTTWAGSVCLCPRAEKTEFDGCSVFTLTTCLAAERKCLTEQCSISCLSLTLVFEKLEPCKSKVDT